MAQEFVGRGWGFPIRTDATGSIALVQRDRELEESIRLILGTAFGRIAHEVRRSLERWELRIDVISVEVSFDPGSESTLYIDITYSVRGTNDPRNLVFPFYVIPEE